MNRDLTLPALILGIAHLVVNGHYAAAAWFVAVAYIVAVMQGCDR